MFCKPLMKILYLMYLQFWFYLDICKTKIFLSSSPRCDGNSYADKMKNPHMRKNQQKLKNQHTRNSDVPLMIRLLFIVPVSNAKLERMFSKLKRVKINFRCSLSNVWKTFWKLWKRVAARKLLTQCQQWRGGALIKLGA